MSCYTSILIFIEFDASGHVYVLASNMLMSSRAHSLWGWVLQASEVAVFVFTLFDVLGVNTHYLVDTNSTLFGAITGFLYIVLVQISISNFIFF
jgi:hypothetical protein